MKRSGWVSPARAADILDVHRNTVYSWATKALAGEPSRLRHVTQHPLTRHIHISFADVQELKEVSLGVCENNDE